MVLKILVNVVFLSANDLTIEHGGRPSLYQNHKSLIRN